MKYLKKVRDLLVNKWSQKNKNQVKINHLNNNPKTRTLSNNQINTNHSTFIYIKRIYRNFNN